MAVYNCNPASSAHLVPIPMTLFGSSRWLVAVALAWVLTGCDRQQPQQNEEVPAPESKTEPVSTIEREVQEIYTGDLDNLLQRRLIRVLVSPSQTNYFLRKGEVRGFEAGLFQEFEKHLNKGVKNPADQVHVLFVPRPFPELLAALENGEGDIAAAGITVTEDRLQRVDFADPYLTGIRELVVTYKGVEGIESTDDLSGRTLVVRAGTSYVTHLQALNESLEDRGLDPAELVIAEPSLRTEDILELVNAGIVEITIADEHIAQLWSRVLPDIRVTETSVANGGDIAWAIRKDSPGLRQRLSEFVTTVKKGSLLGNIYFERFYENTYWVTNPVNPGFRKRFDQVAEVVRRYAEEYDFDWLKIMALAYQESGLDQQKRSSRGAVGVMQILPSTARETGVKNIERLENNIHAGIKYLSLLRDHYFRESPQDPVARTDFVIASYNAGPTRIRRLRDLARQRGLDPDQWFFNVEQVAAEKIGRETVKYVANIHKYYFSYQQERSRRKLQTTPQ